MEILMVNLQGELLKCMRKILIYLVTAPTYAMWMLLTHSLNNSVVPVAIRSIRTREFSIAMLKRVKIEYSIFTHRVCIQTLFDKFDGFGISYNDNQKMFKNLAIFEFKSICVPTEQLKDTNTTTWIGKHEPISVSISFSLIDEPVFLCDKDPKALNISFVEAIEDLANKSKTEMRTKISSIEAIIRARVNAVCKILNKRKDQNASAFECEVERTEEDDEAHMSTQFLQMQKNQLLNLQQHL